MAGGFNVDEDQINPLSPGRNNSIRDLVGRSKTTFRTFQGSRRGGYTVNGSKLERDFVHESIPLTVQAVPPIPRSPLPLTSDEDESGDNFPPPPLSLPDEFLSAQSSPVQFLAIRPFDDEEQAVAPPPFDIDVQQRSPLSRSVQIIDIGSKRGLPHSHFPPLYLLPGEDKGCSSWSTRCTTTSQTLTSNYWPIGLLVGHPTCLLRSRDVI